MSNPNSGTPQHPGNAPPQGITQEYVAQLVVAFMQLYAGPAGVLCSHPLGGTLLIIWMSRLLACAVTVFPLLLGYALFVCKRLTC